MPGPLLRHAGRHNPARHLTLGTVPARCFARPAKSPVSSYTKAIVTLTSSYPTSDPPRRTRFAIPLPPRAAAHSRVARSHSRPAPQSASPHPQPPCAVPRHSAPTTRRPAQPPEPPAPAGGRRKDRAAGDTNGEAGPNSSSSTGHAVSWPALALHHRRRGHQRMDPARPP